MKYSLILPILMTCCATAPVTACEINHPEPPTVCAATCEHYRELGCPEGDPSPVKGIECVVTCDAGEKLEALPHKCIQGAESCEEARECEE